MDSLILNYKKYTMSYREERYFKRRTRRICNNLFYSNAILYNDAQKKLDTCQPRHLFVILKMKTPAFRLVNIQIKYLIES